MLATGHRSDFEVLDERLQRTYPAAKDAHAAIPKGLADHLACRRRSAEVSGSGSKALAEHGAEDPHGPLHGVKKRRR